MSSIHIKSNAISKGVELWRDFVSLFFPNYCLGCKNTLVKGEDILCTHCILELPKTDYHTFVDNPIRLRLEGRIHVTYAFAFLRFRKTGLVQHLLHQLKYNNHPEVGIRPLHESRLRKRGYNQSAKIAEGLSHSLNVAWDENCVKRIIKTTTQTRKSKIERWENVKDGFMIIRPEKIRGKRVLLVDDVITTGATLEACGRHLLEHGCIELSFACLAEAQ